MKLSNPVVIIDSAHPKTEMTDKLTGLASELDFGFAFNKSNFSDRVLRLEIVAVIPESKSDGEGCSTIDDWARKKKRRREEIKRENGADVLVQEEVKIFPCNMPDLEEGVAYESLDCEPVSMIEEAPCVHGDENEIVKNDDFTAVIRVETVHISSPILAAKSPFFYKLFSNGQRQVTLRIQSSEADAFMDLLYFIYNYTLKTITSTGVLDVLMAADKYEVASCVRYCSHLLLSFPMTSESALLYLDLPSSDLMANAARSLTDAAIEFLVVRYKDINKFHEEVMNLPLAGIEAVLSSDDLQIASEDAVYDFALKWAKARYPNPEERKGILGSRLCKLIRFPYMTCRKLRKVIACNDLDPKLSTKLVTDALLFKCEPPYRQKALLPEESSHRYTERAYKYRPVKVIKFELPHQQCIVYFDMKKEECRNLFPSGRVYSQAFQLGGQGFFLSTHCNMDQQSSFHCFGLFLGMQEKGVASFSVDYEFSARQKPEEEFVVRYKGNYKFVGGKAVGYRNLFGTPWPSFMADDSQFFINGVLHISAQLTIRPEIAIMP